MAANAEQIDESLKRQALAEEEAAMTQYKKSTNPFLSSPTAASAAPLPSTGELSYILIWWNNLNSCECWNVKSIDVTILIK